MLTGDRRREILHRLVAEGYVEAKALADVLGVDSSTIRRDLDALARSGHLQRTHGGARTIPGATMEVPYALKRAERRAEKTAIALAAAQRVADGETVILDSGSTTYELAAALRHRSALTVLTNDLQIAKFVATIPRVRLLVSGGELIGSSFTLMGDRALEFLAVYSADWAFLGADSVDAQHGITNMNTQEVPLKRAMMAAASRTVLLADSSKFGRRTLARVAMLDEVDLLITDAGLSDEAASVYGPSLVRVPVADHDPA